jgi:hypothetical protein
MVRCPGSSSLSSIQSEARQATRGRLRIGPVSEAAIADLRNAMVAATPTTVTSSSSRRFLGILQKVGLLTAVGYGEVGTRCRRRQQSGL